MKIQLYADFTCPFSYMGKAQLDQAIEASNRTDIEYEFKAFQLNPDASTTEYTPTYDVLKRIIGGDLDAVKERTKVIAAQAAQFGLTYNYETMKASNTRNAHRLTKWSHQFEKQNELADGFFKALFTDGANLNDEQTLLTIVESVGLDVKEAQQILASDAYGEEVDADKVEAVKTGIRGVPTVKIDGTNVAVSQVAAILGS